MPSHVLYRGASFVTGDPRRPRASGLLVSEDRIVDVGEADALAAAAGHDLELVDLGGGTVVPGLIDAHCHVSMLAYLLTGADCSAAAAPDIAAIQDRLAATNVGPEGWVTGSGFAEYLLEDRRSPTRADLDEAVPDVPCVLFHKSLHGCVVNSAALLRLGHDDASQDPPGGWFGRDGDGRLDGRLLEALALDLLSANLRAHLETLDGPGRAALMSRAGRHLAALGLTSCGDAAGDAGAFMALREAERRGELPIRVTVLFTYPQAGWLIEAGMTTGFGSDRLRIGGIKLWADGGMSSRTAAVDEPYISPPGGTGLLWYEPERFAAIARECADAGFQLAIHAQGERGIRLTLDGLAPVTGPGNPARHRIEHGGCFAPELRARAAEVGVNVVSQPGFFAPLGDGYVEAFGLARSQGLYPYASLRDVGILVAGSSDAPVISASPLLGMRGAIERVTGSGVPLGPDEALTPAEALELYTTRAAYVSHHETAVGSLEPGKLADFVVLEQDPLEAPSAALGDALVRRTIVGGRVVFQREFVAA